MRLARIYRRYRCRLQHLYVGATQILWGADFPQTQSIGLDAQSTLSQQLTILPREDQEKIVGGKQVIAYPKLAAYIGSNKE